MKRFILLLIFIISIIFIVVGFIANTPSSKTNETIGATIYPVYDIARNISSGAMDVELILPPGASTHTYEPTASTLRDLQHVEVVYAIGHDLDAWADFLVHSLDAEKVTLEEGIAIRTNEESEDEDEHEDEHDVHDDEHEDEDEHGHAHGGTDPHYWLSIPNAKIMATTIANDLSSRFPEHQNTFQANLENYLEELDQANDEIYRLIASAEEKKLITLHDAWYYFADTYNLEIVGTFEPSAGREPTPQYLAALLTTIEQENISVLYAEPQIATSSLESIANDLQVEIRTLDPIGGVDDRLTYIDLMIHNAKVIAQ